MKKFLASLVLAGAAGSYASAQISPTEIPSPVEKIFIPMGFDDNDNSEVVLKGTFPTPCYRVGRVGADIDDAKKEIKVWATSYKYPPTIRMFCAQIETPFIQTIKLGVLKMGDYKVTFKDNPSVSSNLNVAKRTTESPDDYLYAPVENAAVKVDPESRRQFLRLDGHFPYMFVGCMKLNEIRVTKTNDVLVVLPIAEITENESECADMPSDHHFEISKGISDPLKEDGLLHVRVLNGNSVNQFVKVER
ncbi:MAG: hypothetical protein AB7T49_16925 [Oligoflexales bacterium]